MKAVFDFPCFSSGYCVTFVGERPEVLIPVVNHNIGLPLINVLPVIDAHNARKVVSSLMVSAVLSAINISQIGYSVIRSFMVDVVNLVGPMAVDIKPRKPMGGVTFAANANNCVVLFVPEPSGFSRKLSVCLFPGASGGEVTPWALPPCKYPAFRTVMERFFKVVSSKIDFSHHRTSSTVLVRDGGAATPLYPHYIAEAA